MPQQNDDAQGTSAQSLEDALQRAAANAADKWGKGHKHQAKVRIEIDISANPGAIQEYRVILSESP